MEHLILYRICCEQKAINGLATSKLMAGEFGESQSKFYRILKDLIKAGFITKIMNGIYEPTDIYQWHMDDILEAKNNE